MVAWIKSAGTIIVTLFIFVIVGAWLYFTASKVGVVPLFNSKGTVTIDQYQRAKDILQIVFPLATAAVGFWFGSQGTVQAQNQADKATQTAQVAHDQAQKSQAKVEAILGASEDPNLITKAATAAPSVFPEMTPVATEPNAADTGAEPPANGSS
jgi:hypothetical protein